MNGFNRSIIMLVTILVVGLCLYGCKDWEYDVERNGIHFEKIYQSKNGTIVGYMTEDREIDGFPCEKGWIHFRNDWRLLSCQLYEDYYFKGTTLPVHTWIHFPNHEDQTGYVCSFPHDLKVQGYFCGGSGGFKGTHTGFYKSGKLRSFFAPEDVMVKDVPCEASILVNVNLYEDGAIKSCKLSDDYAKNGQTYKKGKTINYNPDGTVKK